MSLTIGKMQKYLEEKYKRTKTEDIKNTQRYFLKLIEEVGELAEDIRKDKRMIDNNIKGTIEEELSDVLYYVLMIANTYNIDLEDDFFASFRKDYFEFDKWFKKKQQEGVQAYVTTTNENKITSFLLLKEENETEDYSFFKKPFKPGKRIKISTFKVSDTGKKIGKTFIQIILNEAIKKNVDEIYVTIFEKHKSLINLLEQNGFKLFTYKNTKKGNGVVEKELIYVKDMIIEKLNANMI